MFARDAVHVQWPRLSARSARFPVDWNFVATDVSVRQWNRSSNHEPQDNGGRMVDPVLALMKAYGAELTRENYLNWAFNGDPPAELSAEEEAQLPRQFRLITLEEGESHE